MKHVIVLILFLALTVTASALDIQYVIEVNSTGSVQVCIGRRDADILAREDPETGNFRLLLTKAQYDQAVAGTLAQATINSKLAALKDSLADLENQKTLIKALALVILDETNVTRAWLASFKVEVAAATSLADLKTRVAALPAMAPQTATQLKTAIKNKL